MAVESADDLAIFLDPRDFGETATYTPRDPGAAAYAVIGIFDEPAANFRPAQWPGGHAYMMQEGARMSSSAPTFTCRTADLDSGGKQQDTLALNGTTWGVIEVNSDGTGITVLVLSDNLTP